MIYGRLFPKVNETVCANIVLSRQQVKIKPDVTLGMVPFPRKTKKAVSDGWRQTCLRKMMASFQDKRIEDILFLFWSKYNMGAR